MNLSLKTKSLKSIQFLFWLTPLIVTGCVRRVPSSTFIVPDGYQGLVVIEHGLKGKPPLPFKDGRYIFNIPDNGLLQTSSDFIAGRSLPFEYYYLTKNNELIHLEAYTESKQIWYRVNGLAECKGRKFYPTQHIWFWVSSAPPSRDLGGKELCEFIKERDTKSF